METAEPIIPPSEDETPAFLFDVPAFVSARVDSLRLLARRAWKAGDRFFLVRQHEHFMFAHDSCACVNHSCTGCKITLSIASQIENDLGKANLAEEPAERERHKARELIKLEAEDTRVQIEDISIRVRAIKNAHVNARDEQRAAKEALRLRSLQEQKRREDPRNPPPPQEAGDRE